MEAGLSAIELLQFYADAGVDEAIGDIALDRTKIPEKNAVLPMSRTPTPETPSGSIAMSIPTATPFTEPVAVTGAFEAMGDARALAAGAKTLEELKEALASFKGISLSRTATQMVFADGNPNAKVMLIGEAPGADEDRIGRPFVGVSGQLLDKMFGAIGLSRENNFYISNIINWRPPGNRSPSDAEIALSLPFIQRHIELVNPAVVLYIGGVSAKALMQITQGITRLRGKWSEYKSDGLASPIPAMAMFHPAYLLRSPGEKNLAWADLLRLKLKLKDLNLL